MTQSIARRREIFLVYLWFYYYLFSRLSWSSFWPMMDDADEWNCINLYLQYFVCFLIETSQARDGCTHECTGLCCSPSSGGWTQPHLPQEIHWIHPQVCIPSLVLCRHNKRTVAKLAPWASPGRCVRSISLHYCYYANQPAICTNLAVISPKVWQPCQWTSYQVTLCDNKLKKGWGIM